jgi:type VI secretion system protein ImpF
MPPFQSSDVGLQPSILDRLLDDDPETSVEPPTTRGRTLQELKAAVKRDLENLLNARCDFLKVPDDLTNVKTSLLFFGLPDFGSYSLASTSSHDGLTKVVLRIVRQFEPRLTGVEVTVVPASNPYDRSVHFRIDGLLRTDPSPEPVSFDTVLQRHNSSFEVSGG